MSRKYIYHHDAGHGWIAVPTKDVKESGIEISDYSYSDGFNVFLEEDSDAGRFLNWVATDTNSNLIVVDRYHDGRCFIRDLPRYTEVC